MVVKKLFLVLSLVICSSLISICIYSRYFVKEKVDIVYREKLIRDSIYIVNDSIIKEIQYIDKQYDEKVDSIMSSDTEYQLRIFSKYIDHYNRTTEDN